MLEYSLLIILENKEIITKNNKKNKYFLVLIRFSIFLVIAPPLDLSTC